MALLGNMEENYKATVEQSDKKKFRIQPAFRKIKNNENTKVVHY